MGEMQIETLLRAMAKGKIVGDIMGGDSTEQNCERHHRGATMHGKIVGAVAEGRNFGVFAGGHGGQ